MFRATRSADPFRALRTPHSALRTPLSRRDWLRLTAAGIIPFSLSGWLGALADQAAAGKGRRRSCILLWMSGGPSQMDTFDLKPGHANGGPYREIATKTPGVRISEHLPKLAAHMDEIALIRSMTSKEGEHGLATYLAHTGYASRGPIQYPTLGSLVAKEVGSEDSALPNFVSIAPFRTLSPAAHAPGFLGPRYAPLMVGEASLGSGPRAGDDDKALRVENLSAPTGLAREHVEARLRLVQDLQREFADGRPDAVAQGHRTAYERAVRLMSTAAAKALRLDDEPDPLRDSYGRNLFGQGCLLARRLVEQGVPFVEITLGGQNGLSWDTHVNNFDAVKTLSGTLDQAWSALLTDLKERGLLGQTLIVWMGEFGRTPRINGNNGRDHFPNAWTAALAGGGIKGGQVVGRTSVDGTSVEERPVVVPDLLATVMRALGIDPNAQNTSNTGRPITLVEKSARPIVEVLD
jgi:hypothetical protein